MFDKIEMIVVVVVVASVLFGSKRIPVIGKNIGSSIRELRNGFRGVAEENQPRARSVDKEENPASKI